MAEKPVLKLTNVTRRYGSGENILTVLDGADFTIIPGEVVGLIGPSGSGKTTLLQIAGLLDSPTSGEVWMAGENISAANDAKRTKLRLNHIGFVYQFHHLLPEFSAGENIILPQMMAGVKDNIAHGRARSLLAQMKLEARGNHRPAELSGGECQRVAIARAFANRPQLLLCDEPTGNLDPETAEHVFGLLMGRVRDDKTSALIATHNMELARRMDRVVTLKAGKLIEV